MFCGEIPAELDICLSRMLLKFNEAQAVIRDSEHTLGKEVSY